MIHVKIHCDDCDNDIDVTCEGLFFCMKNPSNKSTVGLLNGLHHASGVEMLPTILMYLLPDILSQSKDMAENMQFVDWLKSMGVKLD